MRNLGVGGVAVALALGLAAPRGAADEGKAKYPPGLLDKLFAPAEKGGPKENPEEVAAQRALAEAKAQAQRKQADAQRARAEFLRRQHVVDRLVEIAVQADDRALEQRARELGERAWAVYTKKMSSSDAGPREEPEEEKADRSRKEEP